MQAVLSGILVEDRYERFLTIGTANSKKLAWMRFSTGDRG
jgi:hypothetical protein